MKCYRNGLDESFILIEQGDSLCWAEISITASTVPVCLVTLGHPLLYSYPCSSFKTELFAFCESTNFAR